MKKSKSVVRSREEQRSFKLERRAVARRCEKLEKSEFLEAMRLMGGVKARS